MADKPVRPIRILLVNEIPLMGNVIAAALEDEPDITVAGRVTNVDDALKLVQEKDVDVALVSTRLPDQGALKLTSAISNLAQEARLALRGSRRNGIRPEG